MCYYVNIMRRIILIMRHDKIIQQNTKKNRNQEKGLPWLRFFFSLEHTQFGISVA